MAKIGKILLWGFAVLGALVVVSVMAMTMVAGMSENRPELPETFVLTLDLNQGVVEKRRSVSLDVFEDERGGHVLGEIVSGLEQAGADSRVKGLILRLGDSGMSIAQIQELRDAILAFRKSGKFTIAFAESFGIVSNATVEYFLASAAEAIWLQPSGELALTGLALEVPFFKSALDKLEIEPLIGQRHEYKGASESLTRSGMSEPVRRSMKSLVDDWYGQILDGIAAVRKMPAANLRALVDNGPYTAAAAKRAGLVDQTAYWTDVERDVARRLAVENDSDRKLGEFVSLKEFRDDREPAEAEGPKVAWVTAEGTILMGEAGRFERDIIAGGDFSELILELADDPEYKGILIRIDSPGGVYTAADGIWRAIGIVRDKGKKVVVSMGGAAASGGYFIAMAADRIVAQPGTVTGSIGVYGGKLNLEGFWEKLGVHWDEVHAGKHATMWSMNRGYPEGAEARVDRLLDEIYADFTAKAAKARGVSKEAMDKLARGRVWTGRQALAGKLVDRLGGLKTAEAELKQLLDVPADQELRLVPVPAPKSRLQLIAEFLSGDIEAKSFLAAWTSRLGRGWSRAAAPALRDLRSLVPPVGRLHMPAFRIKR